jgi:aspartate/methionine/tyrosine aminotransferase
VKSLSQRITQTDRPFIEDILDEYLPIPNITSLALGSSAWLPPENCMIDLASKVSDIDVSRYGSIMGLEELRERIKLKMISLGVDMREQEVMVTCGANQAFMNSAIALCDEGDNAIVIAPYYFCHKSALEMIGVNVTICPFDPSTLLPDMAALKNMISELKPKMVVLTTPNNPSGVIYDKVRLQHLLKSCKEQHTWLVMDETYFEFLFEGAEHYFLCSKNDEYERIIHISSFSKVYLQEEVIIYIIINIYLRLLACQDGGWDT